MILDFTEATFTSTKNVTETIMDTIYAKVGEEHKAMELFEYANEQMIQLDLVDSDTNLIYTGKKNRSKKKTAVNECKSDEGKETRSQDEAMNEI